MTPVKDLNHMHEAEKALKPDQAEIWTSEMCDLVDKDDEDKGQHIAFSIAHATAPQRAEAFLRTLKLWK